MDVIRSQHPTEHPLEDLLDIESGSTMMDQITVLPDVSPHVQYDGKDDEIDSKLEMIYATAMSAVAANQDVMEQVEGKYKARVSEVTATMLNVALGAVKEKSSIKQHKDKLKSPSTGDGQPQVVNNTLVTASFSDLVKALKR